jgi:hypothetical protein
MTEAPIISHAHVTLTTAPELPTLAGLGFEWRLIATNPGFGETIIWCGDLGNITVRRRYLAMVFDGTIITVTHRSESGGRVFAKVGQHLNPEKIHADAIEREAKHEALAAQARKRHATDAARKAAGAFAVHPALRPQRKGKWRAGGFQDDLGGAA